MGLVTKAEGANVESDPSDWVDGQEIEPEQYVDTCQAKSDGTVAQKGRLSIMYSNRWGGRMMMII